LSSVPDVSVSLVNTNSRELILACIESLEGYEGVEIVVLDNASEDGSAAAVRERFPGVDVIEQRHRAGFGANHNTVIRATTGRYVFVLNEDTTSEDWGFDRMVAHLDANPRVAASNGWLSRRPPAGLRLALPLWTMLRSAAHAQPGRTKSGRNRDTGRRLGHGCRALAPS
jgi:GT2 family glycosyltransferase